MTAYRWAPSRALRCTHTMAEQPTVSTPDTTKIGRGGENIGWVSNASAPDRAASAGPNASRYRATAAPDRQPASPANPTGEDEAAVDESSAQRGNILPVNLVLHSRRKLC